MKKIRTVIALLAVLVIFSGCDLLNPEESMKAPRASGIYQGIETALESYAGGGITLKFPREGESLSAFHIIDETPDEEDAVAVYMGNSDGDSIHFNLLKRREGKWKSVYDIASGAGDIERIELTDFDGDGVKEIIFSYLNPLNTNSGYAVIDMQHEVLTVLLEAECTSFVTADFDLDGREDLCTVTLDTIKRKSAADLYSFRNSRCEKIGHAVLDGSVSAYTDPITVQYDGENTAVYIDGIKNSENISANQSMITELIYFKDNKLTAPFSYNNDHINTETLRNFSVTCRDIDGDGNIEIPQLIGFTDEDLGEWEYLASFSEYDFKSRKLKEDFRAYVNENDEYYFNLSSFGDPDKLTVRSKRTDASFSLFFIDGKKETEMFTVKRFTTENFKDKKNVYKELYNDGERIFAINLKEDIPLGGVQEALVFY